MLGFDSFATTEKTTYGIEIIHLIKKGQVEFINEIMEIIA